MWTWGESSHSNAPNLPLFCSLVISADGCRIGFHLATWAPELPSASSPASGSLLHTFCCSAVSFTALISSLLLDALITPVSSQQITTLSFSFLSFLPNCFSSSTLGTSSLSSPFSFFFFFFSFVSCQLCVLSSCFISALLWHWLTCRGWVSPGVSRQWRACWRVRTPPPAGEKEGAQQGAGELRAKLPPSPSCHPALFLVHESLLTRRSC